MINTTALNPDQLRLLVARLTEQRNNALDVLAMTEINLAIAQDQLARQPPETGSRALGIDDLCKEVEKAIARFDELDARLRVDFDDLNTRLLRVEQQAKTPGKKHLAVRTGDDESFAVDAGVAQPQIVESRHV